MGALHLVLVLHGFELFSICADDEIATPKLLCHFLDNCWPALYHHNNNNNEIKLLSISALRSTQGASSILQRFPEVIYI